MKAKMTNAHLPDTQAINFAYRKCHTAYGPDTLKVVASIIF
jgi:hypothetical protein